jgi:hypothetical protein
VLRLIDGPALARRVADAPSIRVRVIKVLVTVAMGVALSAPGAPRGSGSRHASMRPPSAVKRLATMDGEEVRVRLTREARNVAGRIRSVISPPRWDRAAIVRVLDANAGPLVARACRAAKKEDYRARTARSRGVTRTRASAGRCRRAGAAGSST